MESALPDTLCDLNGELVPLSKAQVSVLDRGFIFGDGLYEAFPVYGRKPFLFDAHMARLARNLDKLRIAPPAGLRDRDDWLARVRRLIAQQPADDQMLYIQVTRGVAMRDHVMPADAVPTVFMMSNPLKPVPAEWRHHGVACVSARDFRWERGDIKSTSLLGNVMARQRAADQGAAIGRWAPSLQMAPGRARPPGTPKQSINSPIHAHSAFHVSFPVVSSPSSQGVPGRAVPPGTSRHAMTRPAH